ncbi:uncharacterized protein LOC133844303 [Drosophila sulfurigaster albostrigata]|uniref:uncharacterized protein LOC133844303 n=1 Tax=Drosophila sulfurigaster albostrigata TaxID=89887 RepID=UPI002D21DAC6|nr:uncharacterized protein LOC133844303 [Drosophila sulfurigaster albostrigata]
MLVLMHSMEMNSERSMLFYIIYSLRNSTDLLHISQAMTPRISKSALTVMCSQQFLQLTIDQMCFILQSNFLTVNTECENRFFFCALHWLDVDWPSRSSHLPDVFKCIRFTFLSPKLLSQLTNSGYANIGRFRRVLAAFFKWPPSKQLIEDGIFYSSIVISLSCNRSSLEQFEDVRKELLIPRRWMQDVRCSYHRPVTGQCPNMYYITYSEFVQYSRQLRETMDNYEVFIDHPEEIKGKPKDPALSDSMQCEPSTSNYIICDQLFCGASAENEQKFISLSKYFTPSKFWDLMF